MTITMWRSIEMHPLLRCQLARAGLSEEHAPDAEQWGRFLHCVSRTYARADQHRYAMETSLETSSREMQALHEEVRRSEANFKVIAERSPDAILVTRCSRIQYANVAARELLGMTTRDELVGPVPVDTFVHPDDRGRLRAFLDTFAEDGAAGTIEMRCVRPDGRVVVVRAHGTEIVFDDGPARLIVARDITEVFHVQEEHDRAAHSLRLSEERYRLLFDATPLSITLFDAASLRFLAVNEAASTLYGYTRDELLSMSLTDVNAPGEDPEPFSGMLAAGAERQPVASWRGLRKHRRRDGRTLELEIAAHPIIVDERPAILTIGTDISERRRVEEQLRQSQKMDAIGRLAGGIAHDFNNLLAVIMTVVQLAAEDLGEDHPVHPDLKEIESASLRAAALTRQLLTFSRQQPRYLEALSLNSAVTELEKMLRRVIGEDILLSTDLEQSLGPVEGDSGQLDQVLLNLVVNARDAMPEGGRLTIETRNVELDSTNAGHLDVAPGRYARLTVRDTGVGMDGETRARIFEPFFTTKAAGKGTGLGLATVFGIVKQCGGGIAVESEVGKGTGFSLYFPRVGALPTSAHRASPVARGSETILVVEDDEQLRRAVCKLLGSLGYRVFEARHAVGALELVAERAEEIDLIVTDIVMPEVDGRTMARSVLERNPAAKILYMSGYSERAGAPFGPTEHFVQKPFTNYELGSAVRRAMRGARCSTSSRPAFRPRTLPPPMG